MHPYHFLIDKLLNAQEALILAIASTEKHPWRQFIGPSVVEALATGTRVPTTATNDIQRVGAWGAVTDSEDGKPLTQRPLRIVQDRIDNPNDLWIIPVYWFAQDGDRIRHTREEVDIDVCTYERPDALTLVVTSGIILPDVLGPAIVDGAAMECVRDDEFVVQSGRFGEMFAGWLTGIKAGQTVATSKAA